MILCRDALIYYLSIRGILFFYQFKHKKYILERIYNDLLSFQSSTSNTSYSSICKHFGTPREFITNIIISLESEEYIVKRFKFKKIAFILLILFTLLFISYIYNIYYFSHHNVAHTIEETIVYV